jgi:hypothetical protein
LTHVYIHTIEIKVPGHRYAQGVVKDRILSTRNSHHEPSQECSMAFGPGVTSHKPCITVLRGNLCL